MTDVNSDECHYRQCEGQLAEAPALREEILWHGKAFTAPLAVSTCPQYRVDVPGVLKDLAKRRTERHRVAFTAAEGTGLIIVWETGALRGHLSMTLQDILSYGPRMFP